MVYHRIYNIVIIVNAYSYLGIETILSTYRVIEVPAISFLPIHVLFYDPKRVITLGASLDIKNTYEIGYQNLYRLVDTYNLECLGFH